MNGKYFLVLVFALLLVSPLIAAVSWKEVMGMQQSHNGKNSNGEQIRERATVQTTAHVRNQLLASIAERRNALTGKGFAVKDDWSAQPVFLRMLPSRTIENRSIGASVLQLDYATYLIANITKANGTFTGTLVTFAKSEECNSKGRSSLLSCPLDTVGSITVTPTKGRLLGGYATGEMIVNGTRYRLFIS